MGTPWSGSHDAVDNAGQTIAAARSTGQRRVVTHLNIEMGSGASSITISGLSVTFYEGIAGIQTPPLYMAANTAITATADAGVASVVQMSGYDEDVGESGSQFTATGTDNTASSSVVYVTMRSPSSTTEVIAVEKVLALVEHDTANSIAIGYADDGIATNWEAFTPDNLGKTNAYDLGSYEVPAGKYLLMRHTETGGTAKTGSAIVSYRILKP